MCVFAIGLGVVQAAFSSFLESVYKESCELHRETEAVCRGRTHKLAKQN